MQKYCKNNPWNKSTNVEIEMVQRQNWSMVER